MKRIVILGAGFSGTLTAKKLAKELGSKDVEITLIDKNPFHTMLTQLHEVAAGRIDEAGIKLELQKIFAGRKVKVILDTVEVIDFQKQTLSGVNGTYQYDYLVLSAGSKPNYFGIEGAKEYAYSLWSYDAAVRLNEQIKRMFRRAACEADERNRKKMLSFWVIGAGFSGVEMVSELAEYVQVLCRQFGITEDNVTLNCVDALERVVPNLPEGLSHKTEKKLRNMGIRVLLKSKVECMGEDFICINTEAGSTKYEAGVIIWTAGTQSESITQQAGQVLESNRGRIQSDSYLRSISDKKVYVVGDNVFFIPQGEERPVPQMVENCEQSAHIAAHNIACEITGHSKLKEYKPSFHGVMVSIGSKSGVACVGSGRLRFNLPGFMAIAAKHFINIIYFVQVLGWNKIFRYLYDEFFTVRNRRSFVGGHLSNRTPSFLLVPLRVWIGIVWLMAGLSGPGDFLHILEGAIGVLMLGGLFTSLSAVIAIILQACFVASTQSGTLTAWMILSCIAMLFGGGRIIGLDYWVIPFCKKVWKKLPLIKKWYLYHD